MYQYSFFFFFFYKEKFIQYTCHCILSTYIDSLKTLCRSTTVNFKTILSLNLDNETKQEIWLLDIGIFGPQYNVYLKI